MKYQSSLDRFRNKDKKSFASSSSLEKFNRDKDAGDTQLGASFKSQRVFFSKAQRALHTHIIGSTRTGKSKCLEYMLRQDVKDRNCGLCLIDPHGELYDNVLAYIAQYPRLADRVILFHPDSQGDMILGFNPAPATDNISYVVELLTFACLKAWGQESTNETPRITRWLYNIFYVIVANNLSIVETMPFLNAYSKEAKRFREDLLKRVQDQLVIDAWQAFNKTSPARREELMEGVNNRLSAFLKHEAIRNMIGQVNNTINFADCMDQGKVVLINLHHKNHSFGAEQANLIGVMIVNELYRSAFARDTKSKTRQKPFYVYIDEFGKFVTRSIAESLEELGKFKISFILAHQHLSQLKEEDEYIYNSIMTNCKNKIVFGGLSVEDAKLMADEINTGYYDQYKLKHQHEVRAFEPVEKLLPVTIRKKTQSYGNEQSVSKTSSDKTAKVSETGSTQTELSGVSQTDTETENSSKQIAKLLRDTRTETDMESVAEQVSKIVAKTSSTAKGKSESLQEGDVTRNVKSKSEMKNTTKQVVESFLKSATSSSSESEAEQFINTMNKSKTIADIRNKTRQTAQICSQVDSNSDIQAMTKQISDIRTDTETDSDTRTDTRQTSDTHRTSRTNTHTDATSDSRQTSDISRHSSGTSNTDTESNSRHTTHTNRTSSSSDRRSSANFRNSLGATFGSMSARIREQATSNTSGKSSARASFQSSGQEHINSDTHASSSSRAFAESESDERSISDISSDARSRSKSLAKAYQASDSTSDSSVRNRSNSQSEQTSEGVVEGVNESVSELLSEQKSDILNKIVSESSSETEAKQKIDSIAKILTEGVSEAVEKFVNHTVSETVNKVVSDAETKQKTKNSGNQHSEAVSTSKEKQESENFGEALTKAIAKTFSTIKSQSETERDIESHEDGVAETSTVKSGGAYDVTVTETYKTVYKEFSQKQTPIFFSLEELRYMESAEIKTQGKATAFVKTEDKPPVQVKIDFIKDPAYNKYLVKKLNRFQELVFEKNAQYYSSYLTLKEEMYERQTAIFGEPLRFADKISYEEILKKKQQDTTDGTTDETADLRDELSNA